MAEARRFPFLNKRRLLLGVVLLVAGSAALYGTVGSAKYVAGLIRTKPDQNKTFRQGLYVDAEDLDLGEIYYADLIDCTLKFHNPTDKTIEISEWVTSCSCTVIDPIKTIIEAKGSASVNIGINLTSLKQLLERNKSQKFQIAITPKCADRTIINEKNILSIIVKSQISGPRIIDFGELYVGQDIAKQEFCWILEDGFSIDGVDTKTGHLKFANFRCKGNRPDIRLSGKFENIAAEILKEELSIAIKNNKTASVTVETVAVFYKITHDFDHPKVIGFGALPVGLTANCQFSKSTIDIGTKSGRPVSIKLFGTSKNVNAEIVDNSLYVSIVNVSRGINEEHIDIDIGIDNGVTARRISIPINYYGLSNE